MSSFDGWWELTKIRTHNYMMTNDEMERRWSGQEQGLTALMFSGHWLVTGEVRGPGFGSCSTRLSTALLVWHGR